ncbi:membrane protein YpdK [Buttiauxella sp. B2]
MAVSSFYTEFLSNIARQHARSNNVKYFMMGLSFILLVWVGTFVMMVE